MCVCMYVCSQDGGQPVKEHTLSAQHSGIINIAWSPNDNYLIACGAEDCPEAVVIDTKV